jgi:hypothetical protein
MGKPIAARCGIWLAGFLMATMLAGSAARAQELFQVLRGYEIAPVPLNLAGKGWYMVGLGSYLVNTTGCNDCHTHPNWADNQNPYILSQQPGQINAAEYMAGGRQFLRSDGSLIAVSANITPDNNGMPAGLTLAGFLEVMHTGHDPRDPVGDVLQVMPWPLYRWKTDRELTAMYQYLLAIPSLKDNPNPGP